MRRRRSRHGFALIEVLVALAILATGLVAVLTAVISALTLEKDSSKRARAGLILQEKLGQVAAAPYRGVPVHGVTPDSMFTWTITSGPWTGDPRMPLHEGRAVVVDTFVSRVFEVEVDVSWRTTRGVRSVTASELVRVSPHEGGTS